MKSVSKKRVAMDLSQFAEQVCHGTQASSDLYASYFALYPDSGWHKGKHSEEGVILISRGADDIIDKLRHDLIPLMEEVGENEVNQRIDTAVWDVVDCPGKRGGTIEERAEKAANEILDVPRSLNEYTIWVQIVGLDIGQEAEFGGIQFGVDAEEKQWFHRVTRLELLKLEEKQLARVSVEAYTEESAYNRGIQKIRDAVQTLGIFRYTGDGYDSYRPGGDGKVYWWCAKDNSGQGLKGIVKNVDLWGLRLKNLMSEGTADYHWYRKAAWELSRIIAKEKKTEDEMAIVRSMMSIGNSQMTEEPDKAVLNMIAGSENLACRESLRNRRESGTIKFVVDLIGKGIKIKFEEMRDFQKAGSIMKDLYDLRNDIVHKAKAASRRDQTKARSMGQHIAHMYLIAKSNNLAPRRKNGPGTIR